MSLNKYMSLIMSNKIPLTPCKYIESMMPTVMNTVKTWVIGIDGATHNTDMDKI